MTRADYLMHRWELATTRMMAVRRRKKSPEWERAVFWVAMWGSLAMREKGISRFAQSEQETKS